MTMRSLLTVAGKPSDVAHRLAELGGWWKKRRAPADRLESETDRFLAWANSASDEPPLIKAGFAHLWFVTLPPFDDGNGRIARARRRPVPGPR